jgi:hypothetical protein
MEDMPQRFLRPGIRNSNRWNSVSRDAQVCFIGLLTLVDDYGQYDARPSILLAEIFALWNDLNPENSVDSAGIRRILQELAGKRMVEFYDNPDGKSYLQVTQWQERVREGSKKKWSDETFSLRIPADSCGILPPSPSPSPSPSPVANAMAPAKNSLSPPKVNGEKTNFKMLHELYVTLTNNDIRLDMDKERSWFEWSKRFTSDDLRRVVKYIKDGIFANKRNRGALKFSNLIGMPDRFEEDLAEAKSASGLRARPAVINPAKSAVLKAAHLDPGEKPMSALSAADVMKGNSFLHDLLKKEGLDK